MAEKKFKQQVAREYYNVLYSAKLQFASLDICEKLPTMISAFSLFIGVLGLAFDGFNSKALAAWLLIIGILGLILKPRLLLKDQYEANGVSLTEISKKLENLYFKVDEQSSACIQESRNELEDIQQKHSSIKVVPPVFLSSWYAHYKVFSEHNSDWMCEELNLGWRDKIPLSFRLSVISVLLVAVSWLNLL